MRLHSSAGDLLWLFVLLCGILAAICAAIEAFNAGFAYKPQPIPDEVVIRLKCQFAAGVFCVAVYLWRTRRSGL